MADPTLLNYSQGNNLSDTLSSSVGASDLSLPVNNISIWSSNGGKIIINRGQSDQEICLASGKAGSSIVITSGGRGLEGTTATGHNAGATVESVPTSGDWNDVITTLKNAFNPTTGAVDTTKIVTPSASQTLTNKVIDYNSNTIQNLPSGGGAYNLLKNGNFINNSTNGYGSTPDDWTSSNGNPVQGGIPSLTLTDLTNLGVASNTVQALWNLNGTTYTDQSSNSYTLTATGTPSADNDGLLAQGLTIGSGNYLSNSGANLEITGSRTIISFVKLTTLNGSSWQYIFSKFNNTSQIGYRLGINGSTSTFRFQCIGLTTNTVIESDVVAQVGKWYMVVAIYDSTNSQIEIWVNGIKKSLTASGSSTSSGGQPAVVGANSGDVHAEYLLGTVQNVVVLNTALTDTQVKLLWAHTTYKGQKIRRATTDAYLYQDLPQDLVTRLRGKTITLAGEFYQSVASTAQIAIDDGTETASATDATTGSWLEKSVSATISATATNIRLKIKHSTSDGSSWFKKLRLYEGSGLLPYDHSKDDWSRFPRLLRVNPPAAISGYQFEENRWFNYTPTFTGFSINPTVNAAFHVVGNLCTLLHVTSGAGTSNATGFTITVGIVANSTYATSNFYMNVPRTQDAGTENGSAVMFFTNTTTLSLLKSLTTNWTASGNKFAQFCFSYPI